MCVGHNGIKTFIKSVKTLYSQNTLLEDNAEIPQMYDIAFHTGFCQKIKLFFSPIRLQKGCVPIMQELDKGVGGLGKRRDAAFLSYMSIVVHTRDRCPDDYCCFSSSIRPAELSNFPHANFHWLPTPKQYFPHKNKTDIGFLL